MRSFIGTALLWIVSLALWAGVGVGAYGLYRWFKSTQPPPTAI